MMSEIRLIPIGDLEHHPENPRKDLGDLTELTESIRQLGVMQNLTVVADLETAKYLVVIGNRRLEAAKAAGLVELPCVISDMDNKEQIATMLMENMQRQDLTVYEQAQGFQMMMDLGFTVKEIGEKTGFSETTVNRRLKMAELDKKTFQTAVGKQITMDDLDRLGQIRDVKKRNELLKEYGDNSYEWKVTAEIRKQKANEVRPKAMEMIKAAKAEKIPKEERYSGKYEQIYPLTVDLHEWDGKKNIIPKTEDKLYYDTDDLHIYFYTKKKRAKGEPVIQKTEEEKEEDRRRDLAWKTVERVTEAAYDMRKIFVSEGINVKPSNAMRMLQWALIAGMCMAFDYDTPTNMLRNDPQCPIEGYNTPETLKTVSEWIGSMHQSQWAEVILHMFHGDKKPKDMGYAEGSKWQMPRYKENRKLDLCYQWLEEFGYRMSDEEEQYRNGTHPVFQTKMEE